MYKIGEFFSLSQPVQIVFSLPCSSSLPKGEPMIKSGTGSTFRCELVALGDPPQTDRQTDEIALRVMEINFFFSSSAAVFHVEQFKITLKYGARSRFQMSTSSRTQTLKVSILYTCGLWPRSINGCLISKHCSRGAIAK